MNCLEYALMFWERNPDYRLWYDHQHVVNLYQGKTMLYGRDEMIYSITGMQRVECYGLDHMLRSFKGVLSEKGKELIIKYFKEYEKRI